MKIAFPFITELPYFRDSAALFMPWADRSWAVFIDSGYPYCNQGRYDILAADPWCTLVTRGNLTEVRAHGETTVLPDDPFHLVKSRLGDVVPAIHGLPFCGGAIGYFGYDLARRLERLPSTAGDREAVPEMVVGIYDWAVVVDHRERKSWLVGQGRDAATAKRWPHLVKSFSQIQTLAWKQTAFHVTGEIVSNMTRGDYREAFAKIQRYIHEGDCYQVNLAQHFAATCEGNAWSAYQVLRHINPAPFSAFLNYPQARVLSSSPERFIRVENGQVETRPIKGTRPRSSQMAEDNQRRDALQKSAKDRAENLMIVDLLRNDIGKSCIPGSVHVPELFAIESYATVHHLVSTIRGRLAPEQDALSLLRGCFPGGSITGAPKIRAMEIIEELEPHRRGVYCGAIGYIGHDGNMDTNIAIRTLVHTRDQIRFWAGGGIVADSEAEQEYQECYDKAAAMIEVLTKLQAENTWADRVGY